MKRGEVARQRAGGGVLGALRHGWHGIQSNCPRPPKHTPPLAHPTPRSAPGSHPSTPVAPQSRPRWGAGPPCLQCPQSPAASAAAPAARPAGSSQTAWPATDHTIGENKRLKANANVTCEGQAVHARRCVSTRGQGGMPEPQGQGYSNRSPAEVKQPPAQHANQSPARAWPAAAPSQSSAGPATSRDSARRCRTRGGIGAGLAKSRSKKYCICSDETRQHWRCRHAAPAPSLVQATPVLLAAQLVEQRFGDLHLHSAPHCRQVGKKAQRMSFQWVESTQPNSALTLQAVAASSSCPHRAASQCYQGQHAPAAVKASAMRSRIVASRSATWFSSSRARRPSSPPPGSRPLAHSSVNCGGDGEAAWVYGRRQYTAKRSTKGQVSQPSLSLLASPLLPRTSGRS